MNIMESSEVTCHWYVGVSPLLTLKIIKWGEFELKNEPRGRKYPRVKMVLKIEIKRVIGQNCEHVVSPTVNASVKRVKLNATGQLDKLPISCDRFSVFTVKELLTFIAFSLNPFGNWKQLRHFANCPVDTITTGES